MKTNKASNIRNLRVYNKRLAKTMTREEKLFFLDKIDLSTYDTIIDFGGADGALLYAVQRECPEVAEKCRFVIVDNNPEMATAYPLKNCERISGLDEVDADCGKVLLILSSVLHEMERPSIYELAVFCHERVQTVVMRDMGNADLYAPDKNLLYTCPKPWYELSRTWRKSDIERFRQMVAFNGVIGGQNLMTLITHYILKCDYTENWEREFDEDYLNNNIFYMAENLSRRGWRKVYEREYVLPYKARQAKRRFHIDLPNTHVQMIWDRGA